MERELFLVRRQCDQQAEKIRRLETELKEKTVLLGALAEENSQLRVENGKLSLAFAIKH